MKRRMRQGAAVLVVLGIAAIARADPPRIRHEFVPGVRANEGTLLISSGGEEPDAIVYGGDILAAPEGGALRRDEAPMRGSPGDGQQTEEPGRRSPSFRPDRVTQLNGTIGYYGVFTPTITPFKRVTALDSVQIAPDGTPVLAIAPSDRVPVPVVGASEDAPDERARDRFWGSVVLDFSDGSTVPLPSVSPESRVLTLRTEPPTDLSIEKDGADNFYAVAHEWEPPRQVRVVFLMDAPRPYFGMELPRNVRADALASHVHRLPSELEHQALQFAGELGLSPATDYARALEVLGEHFRNFEESAQPPRDTGNIYLDLARGMRGVCRHRAYAFVITALALGMPARFVQNEAHAWAEVEVPGNGWLRVDLGGAATGLDARGEQDRPAYTPDVNDPLPRPEAYERAYERARAAAASAAGARSATGTGVGSGPGNAAGASPDVTTGPMSQAPPEEGGARGTVELVLERTSYEVFRGRELELTGRAQSAGQGIAGLRIEALLRAPRGEQERLLGVTVSGDEGRFHAMLGVPHDLPVGDYRLLVRTPGDSRYRAAEAR